MYDKYVEYSYGISIMPTSKSQINLIRKRPGKKAAVAAAKDPEENQVWYIGITHNKTTYYVHEVDQVNGAVKWTVHRSKAMQFHTEPGVHKFIHTYMNDRTDIYLIHAPEESS